LSPDARTASAVKVLVDPAADDGLDGAEVDDPTHGVERLGLAG
jgi:hypothetical protein